ncbi:MAG: phosphatidate cytidylyltransferase [Candidatus Eisenbacteria sp.]|nr:phosphatidate cytidylyltransferase [Candidatus Eisenbacteria bacterium]
MSKLGRGSNLIHRTAVGVVAVPVLLFLAWVGGIAFVALVAVIVVLGLSEFYRLVEAGGEKPLSQLGLVGGLGLCLAVWCGEAHVGLTLVAGSILVAALFRRSLRDSLPAAATTLAGLLWIGWLGSHLIALRELPGPGQGDPYGGARYVWLVLSLTWCCDTGAYGVGVKWGRHRLLERVSPGKSVEGALGGIAASLGMAWIAGKWFAPFLESADVIALGLGVGVVSQLGDLVESMVKRNAGVKDASHLIPGHGGVLDRFDSMFFSAPLVYLYLRFFVIP